VSALHCQRPTLNSPLIPQITPNRFLRSPLPVPSKFEMTSKAMWFLWTWASSAYSAINWSIGFKAGFSSIFSIGLCGGAVIGSSFSVEQFERDATVKTVAAVKIRVLCLSPDFVTMLGFSSLDFFCSIIYNIRQKIRKVNPEVWAYHRCLQFFYRPRAGFFSTLQAKTRQDNLQCP